MLRRTSTVAVILGVGVFYSSAGLQATFGQDAQAEATAKATKQQAADDTARSTTDVAKPTDVGAPPRAGASPAENREKLNRRAGELGQGTRGRALIFGMQVKEAADGGVEVGEVGVSTPAEQAGIRKGDKILTFQNFKADTYRKWIDGIRRLATQAPDGSMVTVTLLRDGNPIMRKVRVPENQVGPIKLPLGSQPVQSQNAQPNNNEGNTVVADGGASNVSVANSGPIANFFSEATEPGSEKAVAELFRIGRDHDENINPSGDASSPQAGGARVGFAGFRHDANGMLVMVDVGGLEAGNYTVSIADASVIGNQQQADPTSNIPRPVNEASGAVTSPSSASERKPSGLVPSSNSAPSEAPGAAVPPQSSSEPSARQIPPTILAQVSGTEPSSVTAPATGQVNPTSALPTGVPNRPSASGERLDEHQSSAAGPPIQNALGTLTVDQSGTGRMQHVVEAVRVRSVVGQALVIYSATTSTAKTLPPSLDATADPGLPKPDGAADSANSSSASASRAAPVVGGVIHLLSDRGGAANDHKTKELPAAQPNPSR